MHGIYAHAHFDGLDLDARSQWISRGKISVFNYLDNYVSNKQAWELEKVVREY